MWFNFFSKLEHAQRKTRVGGCQRTVGDMLPPAAWSGASATRRRGRRAPGVATDCLRCYCARHCALWSTGTLPGNNNSGAGRSAALRGIWRKVHCGEWPPLGRGQGAGRSSFPGMPARHAVWFMTVFPVLTCTEFYVYSCTRGPQQRWAHRVQRE